MKPPAREGRAILLDRGFRHPALWHSIHAANRQIIDYLHDSRRLSNCRHKRRSLRRCDDLASHGHDPILNNEVHRQLRGHQSIAWNIGVHPELHRRRQADLLQESLVRHRKCTVHLPRAKSRSERIYLGRVGILLNSPRIHLGRRHSHMQTIHHLPNARCLLDLRQYTLLFVRGRDKAHQCDRAVVNKQVYRRSVGEWNSQLCMDHSLKRCQQCLVTGCHRVITQPEIILKSARVGSRSRWSKAAVAGK